MMCNRHAPGERRSRASRMMGGAVVDARMPEAGFRLTPARIIALSAGIAVAAAILLIDTPLQHYGEFGNRPAIAAAVTALMSIWWLSEALPIYFTACVPLIVYPLT